MGPNFVWSLHISYRLVEGSLSTQFCGLFVAKEYVGLSKIKYALLRNITAVMREIIGYRK
jgi:hypothetical protein